MSHDSAYNQYPDSLYISVSSDKGASWSRIAGFQRPDANASNYYWKQDSVDLSLYVGQTIQIAFEGVGKYGNSFLIDNISININDLQGCVIPGEVKVDSACDNYFWPKTGLHYYKSGFYTYFNYSTGSTCISVDTLKLTIIKTHSSITDSACDYYNWNGDTLKASGIYTKQFINALGCQAVDTLNLKIYPTHGFIYRAVCDSFSWNGITYIESGTYLHSHLNLLGCQVKDTLELSILTQTHNSFDEISCDIFSWNGTIYNQSGIYFYNYTNDSGCSSVDTLHLTIVNSPNPGIITGASSLYTNMITSFTSSVSGGTWSSSSPSIAQINTQTGLITTYNPGNTIITYTVPGNQTCNSVSTSKSIDVISAPVSSPPGIPYQAIAKNASGILLSNTPVVLKFTIYKDAPYGQIEMQETQSLTTNVAGLINTTIGKGSPLIGSFYEIDWSSTVKFLGVQLNTGNGFVDLGSQQLMSVPYAMYSANGIAKGNSPGEMLYWDGVKWVKIPPGINGQVLTFCNGVPTWGPCQ